MSFSSCFPFVILHRTLQTRFVMCRVRSNKAFLYAEGTNRLLTSQVIRGTLVRELPQPDIGRVAENSRKSSREQTAATVQNRRRNLTKKQRYRVCACHEGIWEIISITPIILNLSTKRFMLRPIYPRRKSRRYPMNWRLRGPQSQFWESNHYSSEVKPVT